MSTQFLFYRNRLKALGADRLKAMAKSDELELIYLHLHSMQNLRSIGEPLAPHAAPAAASDASVAGGRERFRIVH